MRLSILLSLALAAASYADEFSIQETFSGSGKHFDIEERVIGFDEDFWSLYSSDWDASGQKVLDGDYSIRLTGPNGGGHQERIATTFFDWQRSFVQRVELSGINSFSEPASHGAHHCRSYTGSITPSWVWHSMSSE